MSHFPFLRGPFASGSRTSLNIRLAATILSFAGFAGLSHAATVAVGSCTTLATYPSIQQAVNSVPAGSTIKICPGTYPEQVLITKNLTLIGVAANGLTGATAAGANSPVITSPSGGVVANAHDLYDNSDIAAQIAVVTPTNASQSIVVNISNITVDGSNNQISGCAPDLVGIYYQNANGTVNHVATRFQELASGLGGCQSGLGIFAQSGYSSGKSSTISIINSSVHDYQKNGITADGTGMTATITGNFVVGAGATPVIAQNGIQVSDGANGKVASNTVTDDVYVSPDGGPYYSASGILLYDTGGTSVHNLTVSMNTISNTQGAIVTYGDSFGTADYNAITSNRITTTLAAGPYLIDGIDLCSNNNNAGNNTIFNSAGAGVHSDSQCTESTGTTGNNNSATSNTVNEACAGVLLGNGTGSSQSGTITYNVIQTSLAGDSCPTTGNTAQTKGKRQIKLWPQPFRH